MLVPRKVTLKSSLEFLLKILLKILALNNSWGSFSVMDFFPQCANATVEISPQDVLETGFCRFVWFLHTDLRVPFQCPQEIRAD